MVGLQIVPKSLNVRNRHTRSGGSARLDLGVQSLGVGLDRATIGLHGRANQPDQEQYHDDTQSQLTSHRFRPFFLRHFPLRAD